MTKASRGAEAPPANMLARAAERMYWLGRYLERADATGRLVAVNANLLMDLPVRLPLGWRPLIDITGAGALFGELYQADGDEAAREADVCRFLTTDVRNPGSIVNSLASAMANARNVRETMPRITFEYIDELWRFAKSSLAAATSRIRRSEALDGISRRIQQLEGFLSQNMLHDDSWELMRLGNHLERADMTTRIIDVRTADLFAARYDLEPFEHIQWRSILRSAYAMQPYNAAIRQPVAAPLALEFLFKDDRLPRSYLRCLRSARRSLASLPRSAKSIAACDRAIRVVDETDVGAMGDRRKAAQLHRFIDHCQIRLGELHDELGAAYFLSR